MNRFTIVKALMAALAFSAATACSDTESVSPRRLSPGSTALSVAAMTSCGASFRMITNEQDSLMAPYGIPNSVDTVDVCEMWTGADYQYQATPVGSSDDFPQLVDSVQTVIYNAGYIVGYTPSGNTAAQQSPVGSTAFDFLSADQATRQASYDYPYYGVSSPDPNACLQPPCPDMIVNSGLEWGTTASPGSSTPSASSGSTPAASKATSPQFLKHRLDRMGVRALVDASVEIAPSSQGFRRFRSVHGDETLIRSVDPKTQLIVGEESLRPADTMTTTNYWTRVAGGHVREHSEVKIVEIIDGKKVRGKTRITFQRVRIRDPKYRTLVGPDMVP
jgi:hypothetical protein